MTAVSPMGNHRARSGCRVVQGHGRERPAKEHL